ncbi:tail fiber/spike domain-containing protein [Enterobacter vonholyi]|uniref:tail fiber/spike domain-containing protein n=1 Tax=Enterobacter vonholyi TaxID=2797505 RepID=UPI002DBAAEC8|nr:GDSL-type esterase/lipase family protein [Enterobacter vonholyi]MEB5978971.1 GDSL-type esterase/lipase family protein [Enterobacter vonholyi]
MATQPTNLPVPSESPRDLKFNAGKIDEYVTSMGWTYTDRFGQKHYTIEGMNYLSQEAMAAYGYVILTGKTFTTGATLNNPNEVLLNTADGEYYKWTGSFASGGKVVPANSTPAGTGGIGPSAWIGVGDASLRAALAAPGGVNLVNGAAKQSDLDSTNQTINKRNYPAFKSCYELAASRLAKGMAITADCRGDSTMYGVVSGGSGQDIQRPTVTLTTTLRNLFGVECSINNFGISGSTLRGMISGTDGASPTFLASLNTSSAHVIYCNHGINDSQLDLSIDQFRADLITFVNAVRDVNKVPVLCTPNINPATTLDTGGGLITETKSKRLERYVNVIRDVARAMKVDLVDQYYYFQKTTRMYSPIELVPDGAHPSSDAYAMAGRNMAIPFVNVKPLCKAGDKQGFSNATYFDNIGASKQYRTDYLPFRRFGGVIVGTRGATNTGINLAVLLDNPTDDTVLALYGTQWNSGTKSTLYDNGIQTNQYAGTIEQGNSNHATIDWEGIHVPSRCKLYAGLHCMGTLSNTSMGGTGTDFALAGYGLIPRVESTASNDTNGKLPYSYVPFCKNTELIVNLNLFTSGFALRLRAATDGVDLLIINYTLGGALTVNRAGESPVTLGATVSAGSYNCRIRYLDDKSMTVTVGSLSVTLPASTTPLQNMYVHGAGINYTVRCISE